MTAYRLSEGWDINLKARIKNSLSTKVFLWIAGSLVLCSLLIYGIILFFLPKSYEVVSSTRINDKVSELYNTLSETKFEDADTVLEQFCLNNQATIIFSDGNKQFQYGIDKMEDNENEMMSIAQDINFADRTETYIMNIAMPISSGNELIVSLLKLLPFLLVFIFLISALGAWVCSWLIVRPIIEISGVSKRMAQLDLTWKCQMERTDEIGILADSLNTMSKNLSQTMEELENANIQLKQDMEHIAELNQQRQHFFATASHELKTPITIIKGQVESMIMEIGRYKDTKKILPETLKEIENMEQLVKEILSISKLELGTIDKIDDVSFSDLLYQVSEHLLPLAEEKRINVYQNIAENIIIKGNTLLLEKALHNIINNAIRHTPHHSDVYIELSDSTLLVRNKGINIPEKNIEDLFMPFYRVEKSHNKNTGGSGLGLYLVKNILEQHGLEYKIYNEENSVCFLITFSSLKLNQN